jgi:hypothetical protein
VILLVTLIALGVTGVAVKMLATSIIRDAKVLSAKNKANDQLEKNLESAPKLVDNAKNLGSTNELIADALPNTSDFPGLMALMENLSAESGVTLKSINPSSAAGTVASPASGGAVPAATAAVPNSGDVPTPQTFAFSAAFDGTYASFQRLIANLEASARPVKVTSVQLSGSGNSLSVQLEGTTYYQDKATVPFKLETVK